MLGGKTRAELSAAGPKQKRAGASRETPPRVHVVHLPRPTAEPEALLPAG